MIKFQDIQIGDYVNAEYEGQLWEGEVVGLQKDQHLVQVLTDVQEFWFEPEHLYPIPLNYQALRNLNFEARVNEDGSVKYMKGAFRIVTPKAGDFSKMEIWYREDKRHNPHIQYIHELQNQYHDMTKVHLTKELV
ncbi:hypothetical protein [Parasediminibacterium sp. JCM 36343]|uniref:hypothetical protein n=1 Tax=Parasediminibacterium sp. JCM 36343 TaxID=3374279 RepID=UPI00397D0DF9